MIDLNKKYKIFKYISVFITTLTLKNLILEEWSCLTEQMITKDCISCVAKLLHILVQELAGKTIFPVKKKRFVTNKIKQKNKKT